MISVVKGGLTAVPGFRATGVRTGIKHRGLDFFLLASEKGPVPTAGLFTANKVKGAPIQVTQTNLKDQKLGAIVANSGCANAYTGKKGLKNAKKMVKLTARALDMDPSNVGVASTGLIGTQLPMDLIQEGVDKALETLSNTWEAGENGAKAIMTTDTMAKEIAIETELEDGTKVTIGGVAKGAGMIHPDLQATMLAFITTDAYITPAGLKSALKKSVDQSFNMVSIDRDTSPNDMVIALANGLANNERITKKHPSKKFQEGLDKVTTELAEMIAKDGEGAKHFIKVRVEGAKTLEDARLAARAVAGSNLVKTAVFGNDPNWGRIVTALGYSGASFKPEEVSISIRSGGKEAPLVLDGEGLPGESLNQASKIMDSDEIEIYIKLDSGKGTATAWGCDLTKEYVEINSKYST